MAEHWAVQSALPMVVQMVPLLDAPTVELSVDHLADQMVVKTADYLADQRAHWKVEQKVVLKESHLAEQMAGPKIVLSVLR